MASPVPILGASSGFQLYKNYILNLCPLVILYYDYAVTFSREVEFFWPPKHKLGFVSTVFLLNRYVAFFGNLIVAKAYFTSPTFDYCQWEFVFHEILYAIQQVCIGILCIVRVYAMYGRSRRVLWFLIVLSAVNLGIVGWTISRGEGTDIIQVISTFPGCNQWVGVDAGTRLSITWACVSVFDSAIFSLTAYKALIAGRRVRLLNVLVRDGAMYFTIIFLVNVANVFILRFAPPLQRNSTLTLTSVLATIMVARVMLNLREEHASTDPPTERTRTGMAFYEPPALINSDGTTDTSRSSNPEDIELGHFT